MRMACKMVAVDNMMAFNVKDMLGVKSVRSENKTMKLSGMRYRL